MWQSWGYTFLLAAALLAGCAPSGSAPNNTQEIDRIKDAREQCFMRNVALLDDGQSDAATIGKALAHACSRDTAALIAIVNPSDPRIHAVLTKNAEDSATQLVLLHRRMKKERR